MSSSISMKLSNRTVVRLKEGLDALDGIPGDAGEVIRFNFDTALSWKITKCLVAITKAFEMYDRARSKLNKDHKVVPGMKITPEQAEKFAGWAAAVDELKDADQDVSGLEHLSRADLQKNGNRIPPGVMANLFDLLVE